MSTAIDPSIGPDRARELFRAELAEVRTDAALQALRTRWVGRNNSWVAAFMEALKTATPEQKKTLGKGANELKKEVEAAVAELETHARRHAASRQRGGHHACRAACRSSAIVIR